MKESGRAAIARYAARGKQYIVMLRPVEGVQGGGVGLAMQTLLYADEVRSISEVPIAAADVRPSELNLARQLVDQIASETFSPSDYEDDVRKRMLADIQRKVDGQDIAAAPPAAEPAQIIDLMEALKASLGQQGARRGTRSAAAHAAPDGDAPEAEGSDALDSRRPARRAKAGAHDGEADAAAASAEPAAKTEPRKRASKR
jgi:DNA end-binding protein Ku